MRSIPSAFSVLAALAWLPAAHTLHAQTVASDAPCWIQDADAAGGTVWVLCDRAQLFRSNNAGSTWQPSLLPASSGASLRAIQAVDARHVIVAGDAGTLLRSEDGGDHWTNVAPQGVTADLRAIHSYGASIWVAGFGGLILYSADGGRQWTRQSTGSSLALEAIYFADERHGWAVGWNGTILRTTNGGQQWEAIRSDAAQWSLNAVRFRDANHGWAAGFLGQLLRSDDGGRTWQAQPAPLGGWFKAVFFDSKGTGWIAAEGGLLKSTDGGATWLAEPLSGRVFLERVIEVNGSIWAVGPFAIWQRTETAAGAHWRPLAIRTGTGRIS